MKSLHVVTVLLAALIASAPVGAVGRLVDVSVYDRTTQQELPVYRFEGRYYVAGQPGHRYQIALHNHEGNRVLGVLSVDGVNVLSGDTADWSQTGYVLDPYEASAIRGWRKSLSEVADFVFADASRSYAARTGRPENVGVIGMAVFRSRPPLPPIRPIAVVPEGRVTENSPVPARASAAQAAPSAEAKALADLGEPLGTGHGQRETSVVSYTDFRHVSPTPDEVITLFYDTRERLVAQGVISVNERTSAPLPDPFPAGHFVPDPR
jgi:hypothetical protein